VLHAQRIEDDQVIWIDQLFGAESSTRRA